MLDLFGILFSSSIMFLVILRAIQMDATQPWFRPPKTGVDSSGLRLRPDGPGDGRPQLARSQLPPPQKPGSQWTSSQGGTSQGGTSQGGRSQGGRSQANRRDVTRGG